MAKNNFKPFATGAGANVMSQADWEALPALLSGFTAGKASSAQVNKAIRQASFIAAALAQYTANKSGLDVLDDGDVAGFISKMSTAFGKDFQALDATLTALAGLTTGVNKLPYFTGTDSAAQTDLTQIGRDVIGQTTVANLLTYLGLGEAAKRGVGTGNNQLPDMSSFAASLSGNGWQKLPSGLIIQWAQVLSNSGGFAPWTYPIAFPNACLQAYASAFVGATANNFTLTMIGNPGTTAVTTACYVNGVQSSTAGQVGVRYLAIGY